MSPWSDPQLRVLLTRAVTYGADRARVEQYLDFYAVEPRPTYLILLGFPSRRDAWDCCRHLRREGWNDVRRKDYALLGAGVAVNISGRYVFTSNAAA